MLHLHKLRIPPLEVFQPTKHAPRFYPIPVPPPASCVTTLAHLLGGDATAQGAVDSITARGKLVFHAVGDTGGVNGTTAQEAVAAAMETQTGIDFLYHLGDIVYYNGQENLYQSLFYEPYQYYPHPIFAIPGNHDGDNQPRPNDPPDSEKSLTGFLENFCAAHNIPASAYRDTVTQPYPYWVLQAPFTTIIGLYGNVDGTLDAPGDTTQQDWFTQQLKDADPTTCILVMVHQPPYSLDGSHGGYQPIDAAIDAAASAARVWPNAVFSGHVHNYQRFTRTVGLDGGQTGITPYIVSGAGGYADSERALHKLRRDHKKKPHPCPSPTSRVDVEMRGYNEKDCGYLKVSVSTDTLVIEYYAVPFDGDVPVLPFDRVAIDWKQRALLNELNPGTSGAA